MTPEMKAWIATRHPAIAALVREFPPGTALVVDGQRARVVSYKEDAGDDHGLGLSFVNPCVDYEAAVESRFPVCAKHFRRGT